MSEKSMGERVSVLEKAVELLEKGTVPIERYNSLEKVVYTLAGAIGLKVIDTLWKTLVG